ncbi:HD domain-containing protein [Desulfocicer vacuolatum]|uniref:HD domain-containing protein n=1 Tax=Desulfocicer vacuolatum TaxID=2298 RepID=UPI001BAFB676|nr:HD domain-containing protein [Desulfocicer vacuolatum]
MKRSEGRQNIEYHTGRKNINRSPKEKFSEIYLKWRNRARQIVKNLPSPHFHHVCARQVSISREMLQQDALIQQIKARIYPLLDNDFGHGILHSELVCVDGAAIIQREMNSPEKAPELPREVIRNMQLIQIAGLLHDTKRKEQDHAEKGAEFAQQFLKNKEFGITSLEIETVSSAIAQHEAFQIVSPEAATASLISDALYDADKFRWGPDNLTHTVWDMVIYKNVPPRQFLNKFPTGLDKMAQIGQTFRTDTGKQFGPDFINIGMAAGVHLFKEINSESMQ